MRSKLSPASTAPRSHEEVKSKIANAEIGVPRKTSPIWHSRGYLPHVESRDRIQHVTFHLADSVPKTVLRQLSSELRTLPTSKRDIELRKRLEAWMDAGHGSCVLRNSAIAQMVQDSLLRFDGNRYLLLAWVVMPNHVHVLFEPIEGRTAAKIVASWKRFTATKIHAELARSTSGSSKRALPGNANLRIGVLGVARRSAASVWHREYWDRYIRDERHLNRAIEYIHLNPVKAGLAATPETWPWSSANPDCQRAQILR